DCAEIQGGGCPRRRLLERARCVSRRGRSRAVTKAVVLLSGGLDSTTARALARSEGFVCHALTVAYGQLHRCEIDAAARVAAALGAVEHRVVTLDLAPLARSALTSAELAVPKGRSFHEIGAAGDVPVTYVPARNTVL